jgi:NAD(P)-dependent dehydrogenase (short-subunit alcohol dehydrogenase family)
MSKNPFSFVGKRCVVTGAATGVGAALIELLAELGAAHVTVLDVKQPSGPCQRFLETDLASEKAVERAIVAIEGPVHALFNNAGVAATQAPRSVLAVNVLALRRLSEGLFERMPAGAAIVNTASIAGGRWPERVAKINELLALDGWEKSLAWLDANLAGLGIDSYAFSKEVVQVYTMRSSRPAQQSEVRVNSACPAPIDTPLLVDFRKTMTDKIIDWTVSQTNQRLVTPREVACALAFLASDGASYINGVNLNVDAGFNAAMTTGQVDFSGLA